jgi:serine/threonine protein kinase/tetratricopeptide (TPR) repeat protein
MARGDDDMDSTTTALGMDQRGSSVERAAKSVHPRPSAARAMHTSERSSASSLLCEPDSGPSELGQYVLLRELGRGAIGIVYAAYHEGLDRKLAIKVLNRSRAGRADLEARLRREARALAKLSHPNVVQVYDVGEIDGRVYVVMEFVEGQSLSDWMRQPHELDEILALFADAGRGLAAAHAAGVIHRDFKPDNVIVGVDGRPRVLDFGLARAHPREQTSEAARGAPAEDEELRVARRRSGTGTVGESPREVDGTPTGGREQPPRRLAASHDAGDPHVNVHTRDHEPRDAEGGEEFELDPELDPELAVTLRSRPGPPADDVLTKTGALMGTPAYMSPEQFMARPAGPASDQFSFCVALHEALYGRRPYAARSQAELKLHVHAAKIVPPPAGSEVPEWLRELILRGLRPNPSDRWPSMEELITALERRPEAPSRRGLWIALGVATVAALGLAIGLLSPKHQPSCPTVEAATAEVWTKERAAELAAAFSAAGPSYADTAWASVEDRLSGWAKSWAEQRVAACEDGLREHDGDAVITALLDRRQACLARNRRAFEALLDQFAQADRTVVERGVEAVTALPEPARCGELGALELGVEPPPPPVVAEVAELRNHLAELDTRLATGRWESGLPLARAAVEQARATGYGPVIAEALLTYGRLLARSGVPASADEALARLQDALDQADRSAHDELIPQVATELVSLSIYAKPDPIRGRLWARRVLTSLDRLARAREQVTQGGTLAEEPGHELGLARARGIWALGNLERLDGDNERAAQHLREALALLDAHAPEPPERGIMLNDLGNVLAARGEAEKARATYEEALRESLASFGAGHPRLGNVRFSLARLAWSEGDLDQAREQAELAFAIYASAHGLEHRDVGAVEILRAAIELAAGNIELARERANKAKAIYELTLATDNVDRAEPYQMLGNAAFAAGELDQAIVDYRAALAIKRATLPPGHIELVPPLTNLGLVHLTRGEQAEAADEPEAAYTEFDAAVLELQQAVELLEGGEAVDPERLRAHRLYLGDALRHRGDPGDFGRAVLVLEAGLERCSADAQLCATLTLRAAQAWAGAGDLEQARAKARLAKTGLAPFAEQDPKVDELLEQAEVLRGTPCAAPPPRGGPPLVAGRRRDLRQPIPGLELELELIELGVIELLAQAGGEAVHAAMDGQRDRPRHRAQALGSVFVVAGQDPRDLGGDGRRARVLFGEGAQLRQRPLERARFGASAGPSDLAEQALGEGRRTATFAGAGAHQRREHLHGLIRGQLADVGRRSLAEAPRRARRTHDREAQRPDRGAEQDPEESAEGAGVAPTPQAAPDQRDDDDGDGDHGRTSTQLGGLRQSLVGHVEQI